MDRRPPKPMTPFDMMVTPSHLYTFKLLLPYIPKHMQRMLGAYIKFQEFKYTLDYFKGFPDENEPNTTDMIHGLIDYLGPEEKEQMEQMEQMMQMMEMMQNADVDIFQDMFNQGENQNE